MSKIKIGFIWYLAAIILLASFFRLMWLDKVPVGLSIDETDYILNAKAVFLQGSDISNTWNPLSLTTPKSSFPQAEIPPLFGFLLIGQLPLSLLYSKLIYALISIGLVVVLYLISRKTLGEKPALFVGLVAAINPWLIFFGRTAYDAPTAIFFYLCGIYVLLVAKSWKILLAFPFFFIGFYSYIGTKVLLLPIVGAVTFYSWKIINKKQYKREYAMLLFLCVAIFSFFIIRTMTSTGSSRTSEIATPWSSDIAKITDSERKLSIQTPLTPLFSNKYVAYAKASTDKYMNAFSPNFLFLHGDSKALFTLWEHGVFYVLDALFLVVGLFFLFLKKRRAAILLVTLILIAPIPAVLSNVGVTYAIRAFFLAPLLAICIGFGIYSVIFESKKKLRVSLAVIIGALYFVQLLNFANSYFLRNPIYNSESFNLSSRVLSKYLSFVEGDKTVKVITGNPQNQLKQYLFYTNSFNRSSKDLVSNQFKTSNYKIKSINFITCDQFKDMGSVDILVFETGAKCALLPSQQRPHVIAQLGDSGEIYRIYNDSVCQKYNVPKFISNVNFSDLNVEKLDEKSFCERYIVRY